MHRLLPPPPGSGSLQEHRRRVWDSIGVSASRDVLLTGVGLFPPMAVTDDCVVAVDARPIGGLNKLRPLDTETKLEADARVDENGCSTMAIYAKVSVFH